MVRGARGGRRAVAAGGRRAAWLRRARRLAALLLAGLPATAAAEVAAEPRVSLAVVATLPSLATIVHEVGGTHVRVTALADEQGDPHFVEPQPALMLPLNRADLLVANGLELEIGWLPPLQRMARNPRIQPGAAGFVEVAQFVAVREVPQVRIDRSMGDLHPGGNPHFLTSPGEVARIAHGLARQLAVLDPAHAQAFAQNARVFAGSLAALEREAQARFQALPAARRQVVAYHKSLAYLFGWLGLEEVGTLEPRPGIQPTPKHVAGLLRSMRARGARVIVQESYYADHSSRTLARLAGGRVVIIPGNVAFRRHQGYVPFLRDIADDLFGALSAGAAAP